jgi:hypothetical protein
MVFVAVKHSDHLGVNASAISDDLAFEEFNKRVPDFSDLAYVFFHDQLSINLLLAVAYELCNCKLCQV